MKRVISLVLCLMMVLSLATTAFADETTYTLTINNTTPDHVYEAYQIFSGELAEKDGVQILSNIKWGAAIVNDNGDDVADEGEYDCAAALLTAIQAESGLSVLHAATDAASLAVLLSGVTSDSETLDLFAEIVGDHLGTPTGTSGAQANDQYTISGLPAGYYLVKDQDGTLEGDNDVYTKYIVRVLKSVEVTPKGDVPSVEKTINDTIDGTFTEIEDFDVNDIAYYKWEGTLPSNLKSYESYYYKFTDTLPTGLQHLDILQVYIEGHDGNKVHTFLDKVANTDDTLPNGITSSVAGQVITLEINDLLTLYPNILPTQKIIVKYSARVTRDALIAEPMTNTVKVEFSNNPNGEGKGETPEDVAHAFTFQINVDKYDADNKDTKLEGAEFVLYYERTENDQIVKYYAKVVTEEMIAAGEEINGTIVDENDLGIVYGWTSNKTEASILDTNANGYLGVKGLDGGIYYLEETKAPVGYNLMETPVQIVIIPTYTENGNEASVTVSYEVDSIAQPSNTVGVRNSSGSTLPSTGGIGTTLFYIFGGLMVAGASVLLITKKRMGAEG
ncbi:MAG: SpaH/EbpB family LPXTG-anchored major pilin [Oscillospiraceae bacterium]|nr:SpaH/EbpB family LPXTG-anchored major pilin [Oscillospiraceae bacterium]